MNISEAAIKEFSGIVNEHFAAKEKALKEEFTQRLNKAKQICVEETEAHKSALARGVQRFIESKVTAIEKAASKKHAIEESEAVTKLKHLKALLEGINLDGAKNDQALQAAMEQKAAVEKQLAESNASLQREKAKSAKLSEIAEKSMHRQKVMEGQVKTLEKTIEESKVTEKKTTLADEKQAAAEPKTVVSEDKQNAAKKQPVAAAKETQPASEMDVIAESLTA